MAPTLSARTWHGASLFADIKLEHVHGEGRGLVVHEDVEAGRWLLAERPACVASSRPELLAQVVGVLRKDSLALAPAVDRSPPSHEIEALQAFAEDAVTVYSFEFLDGQNVALFPVLGMVNHACASSVEANCCFSVPYDAGTAEVGTAMQLIAVRHIQRGEVLRMSYLCPFAPRSQLKLLELAHHFKCICSSCQGAAALPEIQRCCAGCCMPEGSALRLRRCEGCKSVWYCDTECQRQHRPRHRDWCRLRSKDPGSTTTTSEFLTAAEKEFNSVMEDSAAVMQQAFTVLHSGQASSMCEQQLERSLQRAQSFVDSVSAATSHPQAGLPKRSSSSSTGSGSGSSGNSLQSVQGSWRLVPEHPYLFYAQGNAVKQGLTRLAMRLRLTGAAEPPQGCGALAGQTMQRLAGCLGSVSKFLPRFHCEVMSLLRDVSDLGQLAYNLAGFAVELADSGEWGGNRVQDDGLRDVVAWANLLLQQHRDVLASYGEEGLASVELAKSIPERGAQQAAELTEFRVDVDDEHAYTLPCLLKKYASEYSEEEVHAYWEGLQVAPDGIAHRPAIGQLPLGDDGSLAHGFLEDLDQFNDRFGSHIWTSGGRLRGLVDLAQGGRQELAALLEYYSGRKESLGPSSAVDTASVPAPSGSNVDVSPGFISCRFARGDRVLCSLGLYWASGRVAAVNAPDPTDPDGPSLPYLVRLDAHSGYTEPTGVPTDHEDVIRAEICFDAAFELHLTKAAADPALRPGSGSCALLRLEVGCRVGCRTAACTWEPGEVTETWPQLPPPHQFPYGRKTAAWVPYMLRLDSGRSVYAHRDDHVLVRPLNRIPADGEAPRRFETLRQPDGSRVRYDHQTLCSRRLNDESSRGSGTEEDDI